MKFIEPTGGIISVDSCVQVSWQQTSF